MSSGPAIDPARLPGFTLASGARLPGVGLGTFGSDHAAPEAVGRTVRDAIRAGYRHIDCASVYGNQPEIGAALAGAIADGDAARAELWITSKVWNDMHRPADVRRSCERTLRELRLEYLDLFLVHWPFPNHHPPGCAADVRSPDARGFRLAEYLETWTAMERLVDDGLVRHLGTSNMTVPKLRAVLGAVRIKPVCEQMELHPHFQQPELFAFVRDHGLVPVGYCPVGSPARPDRDRAPGDTVDIEDPVVVRIARAHGLHPAALCVKWAVQRGQVPLPFTTRPEHAAANLAAVVAPPLTAAEMADLAACDRNCRLIKGHVFLWKDGQTWEALWDSDGVITPP